MLNETLGEEWMNKDLFRFGASSLANDVLMQLEKQESGIYQSVDYFFKRLVASETSQIVVGVMLVLQRIQITLC